MDIFSKITLSNFVWYLVPGIGLLFFITFPLIILYPQEISIFYSSLGPLGIIIFGIFFGFLLDGLRIYRFRPNYSKIKVSFFHELQNVIGLHNPYLIQSYIYDIARGKNIAGFSLHHAIWIMLGNFTILSIIEGFFWILNALFFYLSDVNCFSMFGHYINKAKFLFVCFFFGVIFLLIGMRLHFVSIKDQETTNSMFTSFAKRYKQEIIAFLDEDM